MTSIVRRDDGGYELHNYPEPGILPVLGSPDAPMEDGRTRGFLLCENCLRCNADLIIKLDGTDTWPEQTGGWRVAPSGAVLIQLNLAQPPIGYCPDCATQVIHCRACGCTDELGCTMFELDDKKIGCWWIETDLCSACAKNRSISEEQEARQ